MIRRFCAYGQVRMDQVWDKVQGSLKETLGPQNFEIWIRPIQVAAIRQDGVHLRVPNRYYRDWVRANYGRTVSDAFGVALGRGVSVHFEVLGEDPPPLAAEPARSPPRGRAQPSTALPFPPPRTSVIEAEPVPGLAFEEILPRQPADPPHPLDELESLDPHEAFDPAADPELPPLLEEQPAPDKATLQGNGPQSIGTIGVSKDKDFENFVVGACNQFAHAAALAVADTPGEAQYNPLFIYGGTGLGKTHLLHAIGNRVREHSPDARILYVTAEQFTNELIDALRYRKMPAFREKYRRWPAVLLMDDVQFLTGKDRTQEELFHTFEWLKERGRQIVFTADVLPREIKGFEPRLRTRCESGMLADMQPPDLETLVAILHQKSSDLGMDIPPALAQYVASRVRGSIREIEGVLNRLHALCRLHGEAPTVAFARQHLGSVLADAPKALTGEEIVQTVASFYNVKVSDLMGTRRLKQLVRPRHVAMHLVREHTDMSFPEIGRFFDRDHATIQHACKKIRAELDEDADLKSALDVILRNLGT